MPRERLAQRCAELLRGERPLRLVYCGRLEARKGLAESIRAVMLARAQGARVGFDIIGDGAQRSALTRLCEELGAHDAVRFLGTRVYGPELLAELASYDALLFTPLAEDTPRMIFDGYAAGLPLLGFGIEYVREREVEDHAARSVPEGDVAAATELLGTLDRERAQLVALCERARETALYHAADAWYRRRAEWTYKCPSASGCAGALNRPFEPQPTSVNRVAWSVRHERVVCLEPRLARVPTRPTQCGKTPRCGASPAC